MHDVNTSNIWKQEQTETAHYFIYSKPEPPFDLSLDSVLRIVLVLLGGELILDDVAYRLQITQPLFERVHSSALCGAVSKQFHVEVVCYCNVNVPYVCILTFILASEGWGMA